MFRSVIYIKCTTAQVINVLLNKHTPPKKNSYENKNINIYVLRQVCSEVTAAQVWGRTCSGGDNTLSGIQILWRVPQRVCFP